MRLTQTRIRLPTPISLISTARRGWKNFIYLLSRSWRKRLSSRHSLGSGFSMIELIVAIGLAAGVAFFAFTAFLHFYKVTFKRQQKTQFFLTAEVFTASLREKILHEPIIALSENSLTTLTTSGKKDHFHFEESELRVNGKLAPVSIRRFRVTALGPAVMMHEDIPRQHNPHILAYLDENQDGFIDMEELDEDGSGELEERECANIGLVGVELSFTGTGSDALNCVFRIHPRNRIAKGSDLEQSEEWR